MRIHQPSGRWKLGLGLSFVTVFMWGLLPIALQITLQGMDGYTITWYRFLVAALLLGSYLALRGGLPRLRGLGPSISILLVLVTLGLGANYVLYILGLSYTSAGAAQVLVQLAPALAMIGALVVFRERFVKAQWIGLLVLASGMLLFFQDRLDQVLGRVGGRYSFGMLLILLAAISWAMYALAQKQLLSVMSSAAVLVVVYFGSVLLLLPTASPGSVLRLDALRFWLLLFAALNTVVAYGAFSEALAHWDASRVNAVLSLTPVATLLMIRIGSTLWPGVVPAEPLTVPSSVGATLVVVGSMVIALGQPPNGTLFLNGKSKGRS